MVGNTRSAPPDDRLRKVELITDRRPLKTILASLRVRLRSALRLSEFGTAIHFYRVKVMSLCKPGRRLPTAREMPE